MHVLKKDADRERPVTSPQGIRYPSMWMQGCFQGCLTQSLLKNNFGYWVSKNSVSFFNITRRFGLGLLHTHISYTHTATQVCNFEWRPDQRVGSTTCCGSRLRDRVSWKELWSTAQKKLSISCPHGHFGSNPLDTFPVHREMGIKIAMICGNCGQSWQYEQHSPESELVQVVLRSSQLMGSLCIPCISAVGEQKTPVHQLVLLICSGSFLVPLFDFETPAVREEDTYQLTAHIILTSG